MTGLVIDIFGSTVVIQSSALWVEHHRVAIEAALDLTLIDQTYTYLWRQADVRLKQDGYFDILPNKGNRRNSTDIKAWPYDDTPEEEPVVILENGVKYLVRPDDGQKTGFYCDQRENRRMIKELSYNKTVLDTYCYSGGFSINAALGGATSVTYVDSSQAALDTANHNSILNQVDHIVKGHKSDALDYMLSMLTQGEQYDIVICDPPKLAPTRSSLDRARSK